MTGHRQSIIGRLKNSARFFASSSFAGIALMASSHASYGQAANSATAEASTETVVVTGSLIQSPNYTAASPITTASVAALKSSGQITLEASLNQLPDFAAAGGAGTGGQGTGGHATLNLHGLGAQRNLVLLDGHRLPFADISGDVDINFVPSSVISDVDVITGGASAVYGSDAMSGVVNFKTLTNFNGVRASVQYGNSFKGDYTTVNSSVTAGGNYNNDKGYFLASISYRYRSGLRGAERSFFNLATPSSYIGQGTYVPSANNLPPQSVVNSVFSSYGVTGTVPNNGNLGFNDNGTLFEQNGALNYQGPTSGGYAVLGGNVRMPVGIQGYIQNPLDQRTIYAKTTYKLTPDIQAYFDGFYVDSDVYTSSGGSLTQFAVPTIPVANPFIPADLKTILAARLNPNAPFTFNARYVGIPAKAWDEHYYTGQILGGLRGALGFRDWTWDFFASYASTDHVQSNYHAVLESRVQALFNAPDGGNSICAGGFNPFGIINSTNLSAACQNYISTTAHSTEHISQTVVQGQVQGSIATLPAGDVQVALVADFRRDTYKFSPDSSLAAGDIEAVIASQSAQGAERVSEIAGQIDVPILANVPLAQSLNVGGAYRFSDYTPTGGVSTYEGDVKWRPVDTILVRGSYQRAVRAPNIGELFSAAAGGQTAFGTPPTGGEPCDSRLPRSTQLQALCVATGVPANTIGNYLFPTTAAASLTSGNPNLTPEKANTYNVGVVYNPQFKSPWLSGISGSVDYYNIAIKNVISVVTGTTALSKCYNLDGSNPSYSATDSFCQLITRDPATGQLIQIRTPYENLGGLKTDGFDIQLNWRIGMDAFGFDSDSGSLILSSNINDTVGYSVETLPNTPFQQFGGTEAVGQPHPSWKALSTIGYDFGTGTIIFRWQYTDAMKDASSVTNPSHPSPGVDAYNLFDLVGSYRFNDTWEARAGIMNLFNHGPVFVASSQNNTDLGTFDVIGRQFYVGMNLNL